MPNIQGIWSQGKTAWKTNVLLWLSFDITSFMVLHDCTQPCLSPKTQECHRDHDQELGFGIHDQGARVSYKISSAPQALMVMSANGHWPFAHISLGQVPL